MIQIRKGLDLPITGAPRQKIDTGRRVSRVALVADDYVALKPKMEVAEGDLVRTGQVLFTDKRSAGIRYTSPGCGRAEGHSPSWYGSGTDSKMT